MDKQNKKIEEYTKQVNEIFNDPNLEVHEKLIKSLEVAQKTNLNNYDKQKATTD